MVHKRSKCLLDTLTLCFPLKYSLLCLPHCGIWKIRFTLYLGPHCMPSLTKDAQSFFQSCSEAFFFAYILYTSHWLGYNLIHVKYSGKRRGQASAQIVCLTNWNYCGLQVLDIILRIICPDSTLRGAKWCLKNKLYNNSNSKIS